MKHPLNPNHKVLISTLKTNVEAFYGELPVAASARALLITETAHADVIYLPIADIQMNLFEATDHQTHCPYKGDACYWSLKLAGETVENVMWSYPEPLANVSQLKGYAAFYSDKISVHIV